MTPLAGGPAILAATVLACAAAFAVGGQFSGEVPSELWGLAGAGVWIVALGAADDLGRIRGRQKLIGQAVAATAVIVCGARVDSVHFLGMTADLGVFSSLFTLAVILASINALNLLDGMDGMLGTVGTISALALAAMAYVSGEVCVAIAAAALAGSLIGFLKFNFPPATSFLGDSGSMFVGLTLGTLVVMGCQSAPKTLDLALPIALLALPILDTSAALTRRKLTGRSIFSTDRGHLHHRLLHSGFSVPGVLRVVAACCAVTGCGALAGRLLGDDLVPLLAGVGVVGTLVGTKMFGHTEAALLNRRITMFAGSMLRPVPKTGRHIQVRLQGSFGWDEVWEEIVALAPRLNLRRICLDVNAPAIHEGYHARWSVKHKEGEVSDLWRVDLPLRTDSLDVGRLHLEGAWDRVPLGEKLGEICRVLDAFTDSMFPDAAPSAAQPTTVVGQTAAGPSPTLAGPLHRPARTSAVAAS